MMSGALSIVIVDEDRTNLALMDMLATQPDLQKRVVAAVRVGERRWNLRMNNGADVMLPEGAEIQYSYGFGAVVIVLLHDVALGAGTRSGRVILVLWVLFGLAFLLALATG